MDAIKLLMQQHRDVETLFEEIAKADSTEDREMLFEDLADNLAMHATIEETIFYPETKDARTEELLREAVEEHLSMKRVLADLLETPADDASFAAKIKVLKDQVEHHVMEEEGDLFPKVKGTFDEDRLTELGLAMEALAAELLEGEPRLGVMAETGAPAPLE